MRFVLGLGAFSLIAMPLIGCGGSDTQVTGIVHRETYWSTVETDKINGIDQATVTQVTLEKFDVFFVVWSDLGLVTPLDNNGASETVLYKGIHKSPAGTEISFQVSKSTPKVVSIGKQNLDVTEGQLILVSTTDGTTKIAQFRIEDDKPVPGSREGIVQYAKERPEVQTFFAPAPSQ